MAEFRLETGRLALRGWCDSDIAPFHAMCSDPRVMEFLGPPLSHEETAAAVSRMQHLQDTIGRCFWAIERQEDGGFIGFCGLKPGPVGTPIEGCTEIGWRLAHHAWGHGYAHEAARAALGWGFADRPDDAIWAITVPANRRSWGLMGRLGMRRHADLDFDHPALSADDPLRRHITYSIRCLP